MSSSAESAPEAEAERESSESNPDQPTPVEEAELLANGQPPGAHDMVRLTQFLPENLVILPVWPRPYFPGLPVPLVIEDAHDLAAIETVLSGSEVVGLVLVRDGDAPRSAQNLHHVGVAARVLRVLQRTEKGLHLLVTCVERFTIQALTVVEHGLMGRVAYYRSTEFSGNPELKAYAMAIISTLKELVQLNPIHGEALKIFLDRSTMDDPGRLADFSVNLTTASGVELQEVLATFEIRARIDKVLQLLKNEVEVTRLQQKISRQIEEKIGTQQRDFFLREQLKAIKKELGLEKEGKTSELEKFRKRLESLTLPEEAARAVEEELDKLALIEPAAPEYVMARTYMDWVTILPWGRHSQDLYDLDRARKVLAADHYGLDEVKERILEFIAVGKLKGDITGSILCLVGPPGVGKTSIGKSIAAAIDRRFFRFSLGGMRDEAEIKGHRRTYIGAMPGKFLQAIKSAGTANPVIMLDEIDKVGKSFQGDPASALLEVLDPEQNASFRDHYLDLAFDLSKVLFVCTANQLDTIPAPLLDRMEVIHLSGYILDEKVEIARRYLLPKALTDAGIAAGQVVLRKPALVHLIDAYAREAGVRNLENLLRKIARKCAYAFATGRTEKIEVRRRDLEGYLGKPMFTPELVEENTPGTVTGLAWTALGGATLQIEATAVPTKAKGFRQTGQLGDVMRESSEIAYSYVMARLERYGVSADYFGRHYVHLHVPAGATPKDGPSAGITMATALISMVIGKPVRRGLAMTGELTLTGKVLPIGGLKEKVIAARRVNRTLLIFPEGNRRDYEALPDHLREGLEVHFVKEFPQVYRLAFEAGDRP